MFTGDNAFSAAPNDVCDVMHVCGLNCLRFTSRKGYFNSNDIAFDSETNVIAFDRKLYAHLTSLGLLTPKTV